MMARLIAVGLGGACRSGGWWRCRCPVHNSHGPTLALRDSERGLIVYCHAGCSRADILAGLRRRGLIEDRRVSEAESRLSRPIHRKNSNNANLELARRVWDVARDVRGSLVARYLAGRGITIHPPAVLRYAPACRHRSRIHLPAMMAKVVNVDGELIAVHRTFLRPDDSGKANIDPGKAALGPIGGGAVRLALWRDRLPSFCAEKCCAS